MSNKEFTLQKGFTLPVLKSLTILNRKCTLKEICESLIINNLFAPREGDEEKIDFNEKVRFEDTVEYCLDHLINDGLVSMSDDLYEILQSGIQKLSDEWDNYNQNDFIKIIDANSKNKYVYYNIPPYLLFGGHRQLTVFGFGKYENQYVKFLNDFIDYIDLNYPSMEEMINFLKYNYDFKTNEQCLNAINIIRSTGLSKIMGRNLSLTKLSQWYINSYNHIALFKIFASKYVGFEEIFDFIALGNSTIESLKNELSHKYNFDWINSEQFEIRLNWMEDLDIIKRNEPSISLTADALELAEYLGLIDLDIQKAPQKIIIPSHTEAEDKTELISKVIEDASEDELNFSYELDEIVDDLISDAIANDLTGQNGVIDTDYIEEAISVVRVEKNVGSFDEPAFNLDKSTEDKSASESNSIFEYLDESILNNEEAFEIADDYSSDEFDFDISADIIDEIKEVKFEPSTVIHIPTKKNIVEVEEFEEQIQTEIDMYIKPEEISKHINLPKNVINKIASALNMGKHIVLTGPHGSGKTSIAVVLAKVAHQKGLNNGYNLASANEYWTAADTIGNLIEIEGMHEKKFKEGVILKSIRENKWLVVDEINKCDTYRCFNDFINALHGYDTILSYIHENYKNIEILSEGTDVTLDINQYSKSKDWRIIATMDTSEKHHINFSPALIRRFAFIDIGTNSYSRIIDEYFIKNGLQNDLLKTKIKSIFGENGLAKYKDIGVSSLYDLIHYLSIRSKLMDDDDNVQDILAEGLELYILPQLRLLDDKVIKDVQEYLLSVFEGNEDIKQYISKAL